MADVAGASTAVGDNIDKGVMNVSEEDQQKINRFARLNARLEDAKDDIASKTNELKNYEDALNEVEEKTLMDEGDKLHLQVGDIMVNLGPEKTQKWLEERMDFLKKSLEELESRKEKIVDEMSALKTHLYARFGNNIHLESGP